MDYDINSVASRHLYMILNGKSTEVTDLINGTAFQTGRTNQEFTNTSDYRSGAHFFQSGDKSSNTTITVITGSRQDKIFTALYNAQSDNAADDKPVPTFVYTDEATGEVVTANNNIAQNVPQSEMGNAEQQMAWVFLTQKYTRVFEGLPDDIKAIING